MNKISIIIPVLDEAKNIETLLNYLLENSFKKNIAEIIIVDGGSSDGSIEIIESFISSLKLLISTKIILLNSKKGRAKQMNFGAKHATGTILYFLHADSYPPKHFDGYILEEVEKGNEAGCFYMKFDSNHWWLKLAGWFTQFNWRACRGGDQSLFINKSIFEKIGGYNENFTIYEDNEILKKIHKVTSFTVIKKQLTTSARYYKKHGVWKLQFYYWNIHWRYFFGATPYELNQYYQKHVNVKKL